LTGSDGQMARNASYEYWQVEPYWH
jgi:hypothetical protein